MTRMVHVKNVLANILYPTELVYQVTLQEVPLLNPVIGRGLPSLTSPSESVAIHRGKVLNIMNSKT